MQYPGSHAGRSGYAVHCDVWAYDMRAVVGRVVEIATGNWELVGRFVVLGEYLGYAVREEDPGEGAYGSW